MLPGGNLKRARRWSNLSDAGEIVRHSVRMMRKLSTATRSGALRAMADLSLTR
jgi:hypothetical protein